MRKSFKIYIGFMTKTTNKRYLICDVTCQNQAFVAEMRCRVMILLRKNVY